MKNISFKLIFRSWRRNKTFTVISILSLAVGIACTNLLAAFVIHEYNIDPGNPNRDRIVVTQREMIGTGYRYITNQPGDLPELFISKTPELDESCTINELSGSTFKVGEHIYNDFKVIEADSTFAHLFPQQVLIGSLKEALNDPNKIVLTESLSKRLFGKENPIGQTIQIQKMSSGFPGDIQPILTFTVSAVVKQDNQAALTFEALIFARPKRGMHLFLLKNNVSIAELQAKTENQFIIADRGNEFKYSFLSIQQVSFDKELYAPSIKKPNTTLLSVALLSAILILVIACFNYVNLSFSRVFKQLYSIHIQKLMGAEIKQLRMQLFADTFMNVALGFLIAQLLQFDLLSILNRIMSARVAASFLYTNQVLPATISFILILAFIPAFYMSMRLPKMSISSYNNFYRGKAKQRIIASLAVMQFVISLVLITGTFSVRRQLSLVYEKTANYKNIYAFSVGDNQTSMRPLMERVAHFSGIQAIASSSATLYYSLSYGDQYVENGETKFRTIMFDDGDDGIMDVMGYKLIQGLPWQEAIKLYSNPVFLNRLYAEQLFPDGNLPIGDMLTVYDEIHKNYPPANHIIAGVVEDYFKFDLETPPYAGIIAYNRDRCIFMQVKTDPKQTEEVIRRIYEEGSDLYPNQLLEHKSMYDVVLNYNKKIFEMSDLLMMYSIISLLLTCFGLFGMALYAIEQRTKEIGIRKVNGSTTRQIMILLNRQFIGWIGIAYVIAVPIGWWLLNKWMENFVYRAGFSIWTYILPLFIVIGITLLTVSWHSYKAASGNPVDALKDE